MNPDYRPSLLLRNGHVNTIYPALYRKQTVDFHRERIDTPDGDFLDLDCIINGRRKCAILCHGLEGSSQSQYILGVARLLSKNGWDIIAANYRGCSGDDNNKPYAYHSGATYDLDAIINYILPSYDSISLVGYSLGGNLVLKYAGENGDALTPQIKSIVAVSVPTYLKGGSIQIEKAENWLYKHKFLVSLKEKIKKKHDNFPDRFDIEAVLKVKTIYDFDNLVTAPIHGFDDAEHYYETCSSKYFIKDIKAKTLIINALDDPFLPESCYPHVEARSSEYVNLETPKYGGHVGFSDFGVDHYWIEKRIMEFIQ